jgi:hypothetical protein
MSVVQSGIFFPFSFTTIAMIDNQSHYNMNRNTNLNVNAHTQPHEFLEQIAITDKKEQKKFFANHSLNFFNLSENNKLRQKTKSRRLSGAIFSFAFIGFMGLMCINHSQSSTKQQLWEYTFDSSWHAAEINQVVPANLANQENFLLDRIDGMVKNPVQDSQGHYYVREEPLEASLNAFYKSSIMHDYGNLTKFEMLGFSLNSPFVSTRIKKIFAEQAMKAMQTDFQMSIRESGNYLKHRSAYSLSRVHSDASYMNYAYSEYFRYYKSHYALIKQIRDSKPYAYSKDSMKNDDSDYVPTEDTVSMDEFVQALKTGTIGD